MKDGLRIFQRLNRVCGMWLTLMREDLLAQLVCDLIIPSWFGGAQFTLANSSLGLSTQRDFEVYRSLENTMYTDHCLRMRVDTQVEMLEGMIARMKAAENNHDHNDEVEMENRGENDGV